MTAFLTVRRDMEGYYVMGCVKSRNRRTHRIENDGGGFIKENTSDVHVRDVSHAEFFVLADGGEE